MNAEVKRQEKIDMAEERDFRRGELPGKFMAKTLYRWDNRKFEKEYLKSWRGISKNGSQFLQRRNLEGGVMSRSQEVDLVFYYFLLLFSFSF